MLNTYTPDHSDSFYTSLREIAAWLGCSLMDLLGAMNAESGCSAKARNPSSSATGLLQWMHMHWSRWNFTRDEFAALPADVQVGYVRNYLAPHRGLLPNAGAIYTAIFLPAFVRKSGDLDFVLCARGGQLATAYASNAVFDRNGDGRITVRELVAAIQRNWQGPRCEEMRLRAGLQHIDVEWIREGDPDDLRTTLGVQRRLVALGYDVGPTGPDNIPGAKTKKAIALFQSACGLVPDGIVGPLTIAALAA